MEINNGLAILESRGVTAGYSRRNTRDFVLRSAAALAVIVIVDRLDRNERPQPESQVSD